MAKLGQEITNTLDVQNLGPQDTKNLANATLTNLNPQDRKELVQRFGVPSPGQEAADRIWRIIVTSFAIVLVGAFLILALVSTGTVAWLFGKPGTADVMLTVFTTAAGFLAGLLSPSPLTQND
jgi:hypothetical protein